MAGSVTAPYIQYQKQKGVPSLWTTVLHTADKHTRNEKNVRNIFFILFSIIDKVCVL